MANNLDISSILTENLLHRGCEFIRKYGLKVHGGASFRQLADHIGVDRRVISSIMSAKEGTRYEWAQQFRAAQDEWLENLEPILVKNLFTLATGVETVERTTESVFDEKGEKKATKEKQLVKKMPPNLGALIFYLTNRFPQNWVNRQQTEVKSSADGGVTIQMNISKEDLKLPKIKTSENESESENEN